VITVLVVDDFPPLRSGLRQLIDATDDLRVVGEAGCGEEAISMTQELTPDVILMDLSMPNCDGIEATRRIIAEDPTACVLVLTANADRKQTVQAIAAGAIGYVLKDIDPPILLDALRSAVRGESPLDPRAARALVGAISRPEREPALSSRETEVLMLVATGLANKQIARRLSISEKTVKNHLTKVFDALGVSGRTEAAMWAVEHGLVDKLADS
jgi:DNA-binding NarL/FixJ family response regulator